MIAAERNWGTVDALGIASILEAATGSVYHIQQDLKGRWHIWDSPAADPDLSDHIARQLEPDLN